MSTTATLHVGHTRAGVRQGVTFDDRGGDVMSRVVPARRIGLVVGVVTVTTRRRHHDHLS